MKSNMGPADKVLRFVLAAVIAILYFTGIIQGSLGIVLAVVAAIFAVTGLINFCPLYASFGFSTRKPTS